MFKFRNEKGLTLIELLITISVLAVVSAIALPVINNVVTSSNSNALQQSIKDAQAFIDKYSKGGVVLYDGLQTLSGYVDSDGDNVIEANEKIDTLTLDSKYSMSVTGSASLGGSYTSGGVTAATITSSATGGSTTGGGTSAYPGIEFNPGDFDTAMTIYGFAGGSAMGYVNFASASTAQALITELGNPGTTWSITIVNGTQSITYQAYHYSPAGYFSPDWSSLGSQPAQSVIPNFTYPVTKVYVAGATNQLTIIVG